MNKTNFNQGTIIQMTGIYSIVIGPFRIDRSGILLNKKK